MMNAACGSTNLDAPQSQSQSHRHSEKIQDTNVAEGQIAEREYHANSNCGKNRTQIQVYTKTSWLTNQKQRPDLCSAAA